jgi:glycerol-1-phosphate dehydrogenase [NAD(P)+]
LARAPEVFAQAMGGRRALVVADENTWAAAGEQVQRLLQESAEPLVFPARPTLYAEMSLVEAIVERLKRDVGALAIAVGAGTINDLVKLASDRCGRPYMVVATAASMDGYTAFGASISQSGSKETFACAAPAALVADLAVLSAAPPAMAATGYADLAAKVTAGADWLLADALGVEPINREAWAIVQTPLRGWLGDPEGVRRAEEASLRKLMEGLTASGLAMQVTQTSRPASGAEHQFSHVWDMEEHRHGGEVVPHGSKVAIGSLASCALYEFLMEQPLEELDAAARAGSWPSAAEAAARAASLHALPALQQKAAEETRAKHVSREQLAQRLQRVRSQWRALRDSLRRQLYPLEEFGQMLQAAGAPVHPEQIGISRERLRSTCFKAQSIRRRYTVLDLLAETGLLDAAAERVIASA